MKNKNILKQGLQKIKSLKFIILLLVLNLLIFKTDAQSFQQQTYYGIDTVPKFSFSLGHLKQPWGVDRTACDARSFHYNTAGADGEARVSVYAGSHPVMYEMINYNNVQVNGMWNMIGTSDLGFEMEQPDIAVVEGNNVLYVLVCFYTDGTTTAYGFPRGYYCNVYSISMANLTTTYVTQITLATYSIPLLHPFISIDERKDGKFGIVYLDNSGNIQLLQGDVPTNSTPSIYNIGSSTQITSGGGFLNPDIAMDESTSDREYITYTDASGNWYVDYVTNSSASGSTSTSAPIFQISSSSYAHPSIACPNKLAGCNNGTFTTVAENTVSGDIEGQTYDGTTYYGSIYTAGSASIPYSNALWVANNTNPKVSYIGKSTNFIVGWTSDIDMSSYGSFPYNNKRKIIGNIGNYNGTNTYSGQPGDIDNSQNYYSVWSYAYYHSGEEDCVNFSSRYYTPLLYAATTTIDDVFMSLHAQYSTSADNEYGEGFFDLNSSPDLYLRKSNAASILESSSAENQTPNISVMPNPIAQEVNIKLNNATDVNYKAQLTDISGRVLYDRTAKADEIKNTLHDYLVQQINPGMYLLNISAADKSWQQTLKIVKQ